MSESTFAALEDAIRAHVADEGHVQNTILTDWYLMTAAACIDIGTTDYLHICSDSPLHTTLGLVTLAFRRLNRLTEDDEDDE